MGVVKVDIRELKKLRDRLTELEEGKKKDEFCEDCARELAAMLINLVRSRTQVITGQLRRGWTRIRTSAGAWPLRSGHRQASGEILRGAEIRTEIQRARSRIHCAWCSLPEDRNVPAGGI